MRTTFGIVVLSLSLLACSFDMIASGGGHSDTQLEGIWSGEVNGVRIAFTMDMGSCQYGCSATGFGHVIDGETGDSITTLVHAPYYLSGVPTDVDFDLDFTADTTGHTPLHTSLSARMPDSSHLIGRVSSDDLLHVDTGTTITFTKP